METAKLKLFVSLQTLFKNQKGLNKKWYKFYTHTTFNCVRMEGLEPTRLAALDPKSSMSTNFTTSAFYKTSPKRFLVFFQLS